MAAGDHLHVPLEPIGPPLSFTHTGPADRRAVLLLDTMQRLVPASRRLRRRPGR